MCYRNSSNEEKFGLIFKELIKNGKIDDNCVFSCDYNFRNYSIGYVSAGIEGEFKLENKVDGISKLDDDSIRYSNYLKSTFLY